MKRIMFSVPGILLALLLTAFVYHRFFAFSTDKDGTKKQYEVAYDDFLFVCEDQKHFFLPGESVHLAFPMIATDTNYYFSVSGVENYESSYSAKEGYIIAFEMPANDVTVSFSAHNSMEREVWEKVIELSFDENPTTGYLWDCTIAPEGIIKLVSEEYVSDAKDADPPVDGAGGRHYWQFEVIGEGEAVISLKLQRGAGEIIDYYAYHYDCDGERAILLEITYDLPQDDDRNG